MTTLTFKSNRDGNGGRRWENFGSYSPCTYQIIFEDGSVGGSVEQVLMSLSDLNPAWAGLATVWAAYDTDGRKIAANQRLNGLKKEIEKGV